MASSQSNESLRVGILGATGSVGQRFIELLQSHPWFVVHTLGASNRSAGRNYGDAVNWKLSSPLPPSVAKMPVVDCTPDAFSGCDFVFSALDSSVAGPLEEEFASRGFPVFSNASNHRMDADVPLLIAQFNPDQLDLITEQQKIHHYTGGYIVCNTNCSTTGLAAALKPLYDTFGIEKVFCVTMQAISGAGYPGLSGLDIHDNVIPFIKNEEEKMETEPLKVLGTVSMARDGHPRTVTDAQFTVSCTCNRVMVIDGHSMSVSVKLRTPASVDDVKRVIRDYRSSTDTLNLPSAPPSPLILREENDRPQPRLDRDAARGFAVSVGRVRPCNLFDIKMSVLVHNTVLGAAGGAILNAELAFAKGYLHTRQTQ